MKILLILSLSSLWPFSAEQASAGHCAFYMAQPSLQGPPSRDIGDDPIEFLERFAEDDFRFAERLREITEDMAAKRISAAWNETAPVLPSINIPGPRGASDQAIIRISAAFAQDNLRSAVIILSILAQRVAEKSQDRGVASLAEQRPRREPTKEQFINTKVAMYFSSALQGVKAQLAILRWAQDCGMIDEDDVPEDLQDLLRDFRRADNPGSFFNVTLLLAIKLKKVTYRDEEILLGAYWKILAEDEWNRVTP